MKQLYVPLFQFGFFLFQGSAPNFDPLQNEQIRPLQDSPSPTPAASASNKPALPKNETPNRFWAFVEPYCAPITAEDIKLLEDLIK